MHSTNFCREPKCEILLLFTVFKIPPLVAFFDVSAPPLLNIIEIAVVSLLCGLAEYFVAKVFFWGKADKRLADAVVQ